MRRMLSASPQSYHTVPITNKDEALDRLYDKLLEDEDKLVMQEQREK